MKCLRSRRPVIGTLMILLTAVWQVGQPLAAATLYWDADAAVTGNNSTSGSGLGGSGTWNTTLPNWWDGSSSTDTAVTFTSGDTAIFTGTGGMLQLSAPSTLGAITFSQNVPAYGFNITSDGASSSNILTLGGSATIAVNTTGAATISAALAGLNGLNLSSTTTGTLILSGANSFSGTINIASGTLAAYSDANLGAAGNDITFSNSSGTAGLTLNAPTALNAGRTITLNNSLTGIALLSSTGAAAQAVLGQVTGAGIFAIANAGTTYLLNTTNNISGVLWAQSGLVSVNTFTDASGNGNIKLGNGTTTGGFQWGPPTTSALALTNRSIELAGTTGGGTIDSSSLVAANSLTINNLIFTAVSSGAKTLTLTGANAGTNTFAANITDNGTSATALTKSGLSQWVLTGTGNNYSGALSISQGTLKVINSSGLGNTGNLSFATSAAGQGLDIRTDVAPTAVRSITNNSASNAFIYLDHAATAGNSTTGQVLTLGTVAQANNSASITFVGNHGWGVVLGLNTLAASNGTANTLTTYTITNDLGSPGLTGYSVGANEFISIAGFAESGSNTAGVTQTLNGWGNYTLTGPISNTGTQPVNLTKSGAGVLTYLPTTMTGWNTGTLTLSGGTTRITGSIATGGATVTLGGGLVELRNNASTNFGFNVANVSATSTLFIDHAVGGTAAAQTATIGNLTLNSAATLNVTGDHGYSLVMGTITQKGTVSSTIANYLGTPGYTGYTGGTITLGNITTDATAGVATLTLSGFGDFILGGTISSSNTGVAMSITKSNLGVVTFAGNNSAWTSTTQGTLTAGGGTTLIDATNTNAVGSANLSGTAGMLGILGASGTSGAIWTTKNLTVAGGFTLVADPLANSSATNQTVNLGGLTGAAQTVFIDSNHGYNVIFNSAATAGNAATALYNIGNGTVTYAGGLTSTAATSTWTVGGPGATVISGPITNGTGTTALTKSGPGMLTLTGTGSNFTGNVIINGGVVKITDASALGAGTGTLTMLGNQPGPVGMDLRNNGSMDFSTRALIRTYGTVFNVDNNGSGTNGTVTLGGGMSLQDSGWYILAQGANGYSLKFDSSAAVKVGISSQTAAFTYSIFNYIPSVAGSGNMELAGGMTFFNPSTWAATITLGGTGDYKISSPITYTAAGTSVDTITKSGLGTVTLSGDSSTTWNAGNTLTIYTMTNGITRATVAGALGGANAKVNVNSGVLDLRADTGFTLTAPITIGASNSYFNADRAIGGAGTGQTMTLNGVSSGAFTSYFTGGNNYSLNTGTFTQTGASVLVNRIGGTGSLVIPTLTGTFNAKVDGPGSTSITTAMTLVTGTLTKSGTGTLTLSGPAGYAAGNTNGAITVNGGTLALDFTGITTATNLLQSVGLTLGAASAGAVSGGTLSIKGAASGNTNQALSTLAVQAGYDQIVLTPNGAGSTTLAFSGAITATNAGGQLLISSPANTSVTITSALNTAATTGRNTVFYDGSNYNWATNTGSGTATISVTNASAAAAVQYLEVSGTTLTAQTRNDSISSAVLNETTTGAAVAINSLRINAGATGQTLALGANTLTLTQGGILFTGSNAYSITGTSGSTGLKSATATNSDLVINNYSTSTLSIQAPIIQGTGVSTLTLGGLSTGTTVLGNAPLLSTVGTYTGITYINSGTVQLATGITGFGAAASNTALTQNGGTLDLNGNNVNIGAFNGGPAAIIDNTNASAATLTIGAGNGAGTFTGTIKNTSGALSLIKTGTGAIVLGDLNGMSSLAFTGNLTVNTAGASGANVLTLAVPLADTAGTKINLGTATAGDNVQITYSGATNMTLNNRQINLNGQSSATITASGVNGINGTPGVLVINTNLLTEGTGAKTLTLAGSGGASAPGGSTVSGITGSGSVATINQFNGDISNASGGGALTLNIAGSGGWSIGGNNSFTGGVNMSSTGVIRGTSANAFGGSANTINWTGAGQLDLRSDSSLNFGNAITWGNAALKINVDRALNGTGSGQIMTLGTITETVTGLTLTTTNAVGVGSNNNGSNSINNYGLRIAGLVLNAGTATTISNAISHNGAAYFAIPTAGNGVAGALVIDSVSTAAGLGSFTLNLNTLGNSGAVTIISGDIIQGAGTTLALAVSQAGGGVLTLGGPSMTSATNYSGGLTITGSGTAPASTAIVRAVSQYSLGTGLITAKGGYLEIRNDASVNYGNAITLDGTANFTLGVGEALNGTSGRNKTFTFGAVNLNGTARTFTIGGIAQNLNGTTTTSADNSGDSVTIGTVNVNTTAYVLNNNLLLPGMLTIGGGGTAITTTGSGGTYVLTIGGTGVTLINGNIVDNGTGLVGLTYSGTGILDLSAATSANLYSGGLTLTGGTARVTNANGLGASSNVINFNAGALELRSDTNVAYTNQMLLNATGTGSINVGQLGGGTGSTGVMFTLGQLKVGTTGKAFAVNGIGGSLATSADSVTLGGVDLNGIAATTITNNLQLPGVLNVGNVSSTAAGSAVLTFNGSGVITVGDVTNGSGTVGLAYTGTGILDLSRMTTATNYSGGLNINTSTSAALVRITDVLQLGQAGSVSLGGGTLEIRTDNNFTYTGVLNWNANTGNANISIGEVGTGTTTGVGKTFSFGTLTVTTASGKTLAFGGIGNTGASSSNSITVNNVTFGAGNLSNTISNNLAVPGTLSLGSITGAATTTAVLTIGGSGFTTITDISNGSGGGTAGLTYGGSGILQVNGTGASNFSGGLSLTGAGILRMMGANSFGSNTTQTFALSGSGGTFEVRTDSSLTFANPLTVSTNSVTINVDAISTAGLSNTVTFNGVTTVLSTTGKTLTLTSGSNYGMVFTNGFSEATTGAAQAYGVTNNASGQVNLGAFSFANTTTSNALTIGGTGYTIAGNLSGQAPVNTLTFSGTGFLDLTGNNAASNQITAVTISGAGGTLRVSTPTNLGAANDTITFTTTAASTLQVRNDGTGNNGTIAFGNTIALNVAAAVATIDVGNSTSTNTGNTIAFGALTNNTTAATSGSLTVNGANGYGVSFTSIILPNGNGATTNLIANAPVSILGTVSQSISPVAAHFDTLVLDGLSGGSIQGIISDSSTGGVTVGNGDTRITKNGPGTWTLGGANTYIGPTVVNAGTLVISGSTSATSLVTVNGSATQGTQGTLAGTGTIGGNVTLATNSATSFALGAAISPGTAGTIGTLSIGGTLTTNSFSKLNFDIHSGGTGDLISAAALPVINGATQVNINTLGATLTVGSAYTLISGYSGTMAANFTLGGFTGVDTTHSAVLLSSSGSLTLVIGAATPATAYWSGAIDGNWNTLTASTAASNWRTDATGDTDTQAAPGVTTDVHFVTSNPAATNLTTTLGQNLAIKTLSFDATSTSAVTINSGSTLTITPSSSSTGIFMDAAAGAVTINSGLALGAAQTWTNNSTTSQLTVTGAVANGGNNLSIVAGAGVTMSGIISGAGGIAITSGTLSINQQANTFSGNITVDGSTSVLTMVGSTSGTYTSSSPLGTFTAGSFKTVTLTNGGTFSLISNNYNVNTTGTNIGAGQVFVIGTGGGTLNVASGSLLTMDDGTGTGTASTNAELQGSGDLTKTGGGTLSLGNGTSNFSVFTGNIFIKEGILKTGNAAAIFSNITLGSATTNGTLDINSFSNTITGLFVASGATAASQIVGNSSTSAGGTLILNVSGTNLFSGTIQNTVGSGTKTTGITMAGPGSLILTGKNTYTGGTNVQNGTVQLAGGDNLLAANSVVTLGSGTTSGKLIIGGDSTGAAGTDPTSGNQHSLILTQSSAASILAVSGTGTLNSVVGGAAGGTSAGTPTNNSTLTLNIGAGFTDTYAGLIGWDGTGSVGVQNNINLIKSGGGTLVLSADLSKWTGTNTAAAPNTINTTIDPTRPELQLTGGVLRLTSTAVINTVIRNTGGVIDDLGATYGNNYYLIVSGGLIAFSQAGDTFTNSGLTSSSHGVGALNIAGNNAITDYVGSDMYLGAIGARVFASPSLAVGAGGKYRLGGGAAWQNLGSASVGGSGGYLQISTAGVITGGNDVIIGDNGTYNGGSGLFGGNSTVEFTKDQNYTGTTTLAGGTLVFSNVTQLGSPTTSAGSIILDGGILRYSGITTDVSGRITIAAGGGIDTNGQSVIFATALGNNNTGTSGLDNGGLTKTGTGTLTLSRANTFVGTTTVSQGTLMLDFNQAGATASDILSNGAAGVSMNGGTLTVNAAGGTTANTQRIAATNLNAGTNLLNLNTAAAFSGAGALNLELGQINRSTGSGLNIVAGTDFTLGTTAGNVTTTNSNINGIISGGITISGTGITGNTWAVSGATQATNLAWDGTTGSGTNTITGSGYTNGARVSFSGTVPGGLSSNQAYYVVNTTGTTFQVAASLGGTAITLTDSGTNATVSTGGAITGLATGSYYTTTTGGNTATNYLSTANVDVTSSPTLNAGITINSLRFSSATTQTLTLTGTNIISTGGILVSSAVGNVATTIAGGTLAGAAGGDLIINNYDISSSLTISSVIADNASATGLTKNGTGAVVLSGTNTYSGQTVINGGSLSVSLTANLGNTTGITLNGGTFANTGTVNIAKVFTLGLNGGTISLTGGGNQSAGTAGDALLFLGSGARTLTLNSVADRKMTFNFSIGDNGGPTSLVVNGAGDTSYMVLSASNSYTGTTTITRGILEVNNAGALPGGFGGLTQTSANTGGGNLIFNGSGSNRAILEFTANSNTGFYRSLGTGFDQVQWTGSGGFSNFTTGTLVVNLGGAGAGVTWGSGNFVPTGNVLQFGQAAGNGLTSGGAIDFQNPINLGTAVRTIDVSNGVNTSATVGVDLFLSGALTGGSGGGLNKTGGGVLKLTANNSAGTHANATTSVVGTLILANTGATDLSALLGSGATNRTLTINAGGAVVLTGQTDWSALMNRVVTTSAGGLALDVSYNGVVDLSGFTALGLGAYSETGGTPIYFGGTITPNGTVFRFNSGQTNSGGTFGSAATTVQAAVSLLVLNRVNLITNNGATSRSANFAAGEFYLMGYNTYTGGTVVNNTSGGASQIGIGNDAAFGIGAISASPTTASTAYFGALNGDHTLSNNITLGAAGNFVIAGNTVNRGIANAGSMTYLGTINLPATVSLFSEGGLDAVVLGDLKPTGTTTAVTLSNNSGGLYSLLTTPNGAVNKTFTSSIINASTVTLVIDSDRSLGAVPASAATNLTFSTGSGTLAIQPGTSSVTLSANRNIVLSSNIGAGFNVYGGTISISGITTGNLTGNSTLTIPGIISGGGTGLFTKSGLGTLVLQGTNTFTATTAATGLVINAGTVQLDYANLAGAGPILNNTTTMTLNLGAAANGTLSNGGTLYISNGSTAKTQSFTGTTVNAKDNYIWLDSTAAGGVTTLGLGAITRTVGSTLNFIGNTSGFGQAVINASNAAGILPGATWGGNDLVATSGSALSIYNGYTGLTGSTIVSAAAANIKVDSSTTGNVTLAATGVISINTLTFSDTVARTIDVRNGSTQGTLNFGTVGTILAGSGTGALTLGVSGSPGTLNAGGTTTTTSGELIFVNNSANTMTVNSVIQNNTGTGAVTTVVKSGSGVLTLAGANTYTGSLYINSGIVQYSDGSAAAKNLGSATVAAANIIMNGGALRYTGSTSNNLIFGMTYNSISAFDVQNSAGTVVAGTTTALSGMTGINGVAGILQKTGAGTLTLSGSVSNANLSVEVVAGTLNLSKTSSSTVFAVDQAGGGAALIIDAGAKAVLGGTVGNQISDTSSVVVKGTFDLNGLSEGFDGLGGSGTVTNNATGTSTLTLGTNNDSNISANTLFAAAAGVATTGINNFTGVIQDGGTGKVVAVVKAGAGTQTLSAQSTYSGGTTINAGTLKMGVANALLQTGNVTVAGTTVVNALVVPGTFDLGGFNQSIGGLSSTTGGYVTNTIALTWSGSAWAAASGTNTLTVGNGNATSSFNGILQDGFTVIPNPGTGAGTSATGTLALTKTGTGTQTLSGFNTASGVLTVNQGEVDLNSSATTATNNAWSGNVIVNTTGILKLLQSNQILDSKTLTVAGGTFQLNGGSETVGGVQLTGGGFILDTAGGGALTSTTTFDLQSGTVSGILAGGVGVSKTTSGTVTLSGANTFTGKTSVTGGVLSISADNNLGAAPGSSVADQLTLDGGTLKSTATLVIASTRGITVGTGGGTFDTAAGTTATINSVIQSSGPIIKTGAGTLVFSAANTYTGRTSIQQGALSVASINSVATPAQSLGSGLGTPSNAANGTVDLGAATTSGALVYTGTGETTDRVINLAGTTGGGTLDQSGTGVVKFTSDLTATGVGAKILTLQGSTAGTGEISGAIVDNGGSNTTGVTKEGTGTWVLSGSNTYTGATTVNGGTLQVGANGTGSIGSSVVTVNSTATLSGSGMIAGRTVIGGGGVLAPGDGGPGASNTTLTFGASTVSLTVADTGSIQLGLTTADSIDSGFAAWFQTNPTGTAADYVASIGGIDNTGPGVSWNDVHSGSHDFISAADTVILGSTNTTDKRVVVSLNNLSGVTYGSVFNLMDWSTLGLTHDDSALSAMGAFSVANNLQLQDLTSVYPGLAWDTSLFDSYGIVVVVPEPGRMLFLMLGLLGLLARRRRRIVG